MCDVISSSFSKFENQGIQNLQSLRLSLDFVILKKEELCVPRLPTLRSTATNQTIGEQPAVPSATGGVHCHVWHLFFSGKLEVAAH